MQSCGIYRDEQNVVSSFKDLIFQNKNQDTYLQQ